MKTRWMIVLWLIVVIVQVALVAIIFSPKYVIEQQKVETANVRSLLGSKAESKIAADARQSYYDAFVKSGFNNTVIKTFTTSEAERRRSKGLQDFGRGAEKWFENRYRVFMEVMKGAMYRFHYLFLLLPHILPLILVGLIDGMVRRQEKKSMFGYANPTFYHFAKYLIFISVVSPFVLAFVPMGVNPYVFGLWFMMTPFVIWLGVSNVQHYAGD